MTLIMSRENDAKVKALKKVKETQWNGNTRHQSLIACLVAINLESSNSGHYDPKTTKIPGLKGFYMINADGSLYCEARVIKEGEKSFLIEYLLPRGCSEFEDYYVKFLNES